MLPLYDVIFDTNVVVSASRPRRSLGLRSSAELLGAWRRAEIRGVVSGALLAEYAEVLAREECGVDEDHQRAALALAVDGERTLRAEIGEPPFRRVSKDPKDDHLFALIDASDPDYLCTRDIEDVLDLHLWRDTVIVSPEILYSIYVYDVLVARALSRG